jgi:hypothetical protein
VHGDVAETVDSMLRGYKIPAEVRELGDDGDVRVIEVPQPINTSLRGRAPRERSSYATQPRDARETGVNGASFDAPFRRLYPFGISRKRLEQAIRETGAPAAIAEELTDADTVMTLRTYFRRKPQALRDAEARGIPIYVLKTNTVAQMEQGLVSMAQHGEAPAGEGMQYAMQETEDAIAEVLNGDDSTIDLTPQNAYIRRLQHQMAQRYNLTSRSFGREPQRRVRISKDGEEPAWFA